VFGANLFYDIHFLATKRVNHRYLLLLEAICPCFCYDVPLYFREYLWKFFYPSDYQGMTVTKVPEPGELRMFKTFEFRMNIVAEATNDVLFTKNSVSAGYTMYICVYLYFILFFIYM